MVSDFFMRISWLRMWYLSCYTTASHWNVSDRIVSVMIIQRQRRTILSILGPRHWSSRSGATSKIRKPRKVCDPLLFLDTVSRRRKNPSLARWSGLMNML
ncbi:hypothetical protein PILCRDRAFT_747066 [Piloderma croceum F 1598]|uniref:Uncharacterized protein n=1 Tax=Piloderma croceum (strain F 1598) TaxID=765440 RepID=A0A0C3EH34_PILCF|nr:hypothetical protein PILCRDRAFT_747066 [Piloderma croceum F 1598]